MRHFRRGKAFHPQALEYLKHWGRVNKNYNDRSPSISENSRDQTYLVTIPLPLHQSK